MWNGKSQYEGGEIDNEEESEENGEEGVFFCGDAGGIGGVCCDVVAFASLLVGSDDCCEFCFGGALMNDCTMEEKFSNPGVGYVQFVPRKRKYD